MSNTEMTTFMNDLGIQGISGPLGAWLYVVLVDEWRVTPSPNTSMGYLSEECWYGLIVRAIIDLYLFRPTEIEVDSALAKTQLRTIADFAKVITNIASGGPQVDGQLVAIANDNCSLNRARIPYLKTADSVTHFVLGAALALEEKQGGVPPGSIPKTPSGHLSRPIVFFKIVLTTL